MNIVQQLFSARERVEDLESNLIGMKINYKEHDYCIVDAVDGDFVSLYIEDDNGEVSRAGITLEKLQECLNWGKGNIIASDKNDCSS